MDVHQIKVEETFPGTKYLYLRVREGNRSYWVATAPSEVKVGEVYYYNEALIRANFESKEMQKVFDTLYLVTKLVPEFHAGSLKPLKEVPPPPKQKEATEQAGESRSKAIPEEANTVSIAELLKDPKAFEGTFVEVRGTCTKINKGILGRNWIHLKDPKDNDSKLVVTSQDEVAPGELVTFQAQVALNKDFGAGYTYEILLENGQLLER